MGHQMPSYSHSAWQQKKKRIFYIWEIISLQQMCIWVCESDKDIVSLCGAASLAECFPASGSAIYPSSWFLHIISLLSFSLL